ncbi:hypothetical protein XENOCAPTIV_018111 [Xenoophorus captivus]|uniref:Ubiquitin-like domain-containing protein n=1 Tax=Xenoophorus captivus TaxID=1517983 RepID=A0ABV0QM63_9TELE
MLKWSPKERGKDPNATPSDCFLQLETILQLKLVHVLNMMSAKILIYAISDDETVANLQLRIEKDTNIPAANQELLLEAGLVLEPNALASQCAIDYMEVDGRRTDYPLVFLFDCSSCTYEPQFSPRILPENVHFIQNDSRYVLQYSQLRRTCGQVWHTIRSLKEDWQRLQQGQKAAMPCSSTRRNSEISTQSSGHPEQQPFLLSKCFIFCVFCSKTATCRHRVMELLPKVEEVVQKLAESELILMGLQERRQRELDESLVEESRTFESRLQSLLQETIQESESGMEVCKLLLKVMSLLWFIILLELCKSCFCPRC